MAEIGWIKLATSLPDNKKIKRIRKLPDGNNVILFWVFLLARAGESNKAGGLFLTDTLPYAEEDLAADFDFSIEFVKFALLTLEKYSMIDRYEEILFIKNWEKYQAVDSLEKIREQNRLRQQKYRKKQKQLTLEAPSNVTNNVTRNDEITHGNALEKEEDKEIDKDSSSSNSVQLSDVVSFYQNNFGVMASIVQEDLIYWSNDLSPELVVEAMKKAAFNQKPYSYAKGIMNNWSNLNIKSLDQVEQQELQFELNKQQKTQSHYGRSKKVEKLPQHMQSTYEEKPLSAEEQEKLAESEAELRDKLERMTRGDD